MIRAKVLGRKLSERLSKPDLRATFSDVCLVKMELRSNDRTIQVICFVKAMYRLHVFRRNPRDGCYFHEQKNDIIKTNKDLDVFVVALKRVACEQQTYFRSPHGKFHRFLFPFSSKFSDLNFTSYVLYIFLYYVTCHTQ